MHRCSRRGAAHVVVVAHVLVFHRLADGETQKVSHILGERGRAWRAWARLVIQERREREVVVGLARLSVQALAQVAVVLLIIGHTVDRVHPVPRVHAAASGLAELALGSAAAAEIRPTAGSAKAEALWGDSRNRGRGRQEEECR